MKLFPRRTQKIISQITKY